MLIGELSNAQTLCLYCKKMFCSESHKHTWLWNWRCLVRGSHCSDMVLLRQMKILLFSSNHHLSLDVQEFFIIFFYLSKGLRVNTSLYCEKVEVEANLCKCLYMLYQLTNSLFNSGSSSLLLYVSSINTEGYTGVIRSGLGVDSVLTWSTRSEL